jgi:hypothetical protein
LFFGFPLFTQSKPIDRTKILEATTTIPLNEDTRSLDKIRFEIRSSKFPSRFTMLFTQAWKSLARNRVVSTFARRAKSTADGGEAEIAAGGLVTAMGTTFATYMMADFLSNFIQHPTQKVRD